MVDAAAIVDGAASHPLPADPLPDGERPPVAPSSQWQADDGGWALLLAGDWRGAGIAALPAAPDEALAPRADGGAVRVRLVDRGLTRWDAELPALLWQCLTPLRQRRVSIDIDALPPALHAVLELALHAEPAAAPAGPATVASAIRARVIALGEWVRTAGIDALITATFLGEVMLAVGRWLRGKADMRLTDLFDQIDRCGPKSLPIVSLVCGLVGLMLAYMGGAQLERIGAPHLIANVVTVGMVRELAGLMIGIILAGRLGAAFAAQLGSMQADEEVDALRALGIDPISYLVLPRLIALMVVAPLLWAYAALVGVLAGMPAAAAVYGVPPADYLNKCVSALTFTHVWVGLFKCGIYVVLLALAGCREGLYAGRSTEAVGDATTTAVVKSLVWIVAAACGSTMVFQSLKL